MELQKTAEELWKLAAIATRLNYFPRVWTAKTAHTDAVKINIATPALQIRYVEINQEINPIIWHFGLSHTEMTS